MILFLILSFGCAFGAGLFTLNVVWGDKYAKMVRNALGGLAVLFYIVFLGSANFSGGLQVVFIGLPILGIGVLLSEPAMLKGVNPPAMAWITTAIGGGLLIVGALITLFQGGLR